MPIRDDDVWRRLDEMGLVLPAPPQALAAYVPCVIHGGVAYVAGQVPMDEGSLVSPGIVGLDVSIDEAALAARRAALQALSVLRAALGTLDRLERLLQVTVYVAAPAGSSEHPQVANGASDLFVEVLGDEGRHARAAVGVSSLPLGSSVEVAVTAAVAG